MYVSHFISCSDFPCQITDVQKADPYFRLFNYTSTKLIFKFPIKLRVLRYFDLFEKQSWCGFRIQRETHLRHQNLTARTFLVSALIQHSIQPPHLGNPNPPQWDGGIPHLMSSPKLHNNPHRFIHQKSNVNVSDCSTATQQYFLLWESTHSKANSWTRGTLSLELGLLKGHRESSRVLPMLETQLLQTT